MRGHLQVRLSEHCIGIMEHGAFQALRLSQRCTEYSSLLRCDAVSSGICLRNADNYLPVQMT